MSIPTIGGEWIPDPRSFSEAMDRIRDWPDRYPLYCVLLYVGARPGGIDAEIARYARRLFDALDAMTGDDCLVFIIDDPKGEPDEAAAGALRPLLAAEGGSLRSLAAVTVAE